MADKKYVYQFDEAYGLGKELLGGKGAGLAEMTHIGVPIPEGFTITTEACTLYYNSGKKLPQYIIDAVYENIAKVEKKTGKKYGILLTIHMDPVDTKSKDLPILKEHINEVIKSLDLGLTFHDLRAVTGPTHTNVIFDLVLPNDRKIDKNKLTKIFRQELRKVDEHYNVVINFDEKYVK